MKKKIYRINQEPHDPEYLRIANKFGYWLANYHMPSKKFYFNKDVSFTVKNIKQMKKQIKNTK